jgi:hypothetical protein
LFWTIAILLLESAQDKSLRGEYKSLDLAL